MTNESVNAGDSRSVVRVFLISCFYYIYNEIIAHIPFYFVRAFFCNYIFRRFGEGAVLMRGVRIKSGRLIEIGSGCIINRGVCLDGRGGLIISDNVDIAEGVQIMTASHNTASPLHEYITSSVYIGNYVWLATRCMIMPGVRIGEGAVVAAGSIVTRDVDAYAIVAGVPARIIGTRCKELNYKLNHKPFLG